MTSKMPDQYATVGPHKVEMSLTCSSSQGTITLMVMTLEPGMKVKLCAPIRNNVNDVSFWYFDKIIHGRREWFVDAQ